MDTYKVPLDATRKALDEAAQQAKDAEAARLEMERKERMAREMVISKDPVYSELVWKKMKHRRKMANQSRRKNRK